MSNKMTMRKESVTPRKAAEYLKHNTRNRNMRTNHVKDLARDMAAGEFQPTHMPIAFNCDGTLLDGQHRLQAVIMSETTQEFWVCRGLTDAANLYTDTQSRRSDADAFIIQGMHCTNMIVATARHMMYGPRDRGATARPGRLEIRKFIERHAEALDFAVPASAPAKVGRSAGLACVARAFYHEDRDRLSRFLQLLLHGPSDKPTAVDATALRFRELALTYDRHDAHGRVDFYRRCQSVVKAFCSGRQIKNIKPTETDLYPLPTA